MTPRAGQKKGQGQGGPPFRVGVILDGVICKLDGTPEDDVTHQRDAAAHEGIATAGLNANAVSRQLIRIHGVVGRKNGAPLMPGIVTRQHSATAAMKRTARSVYSDLDKLIKAARFDDPAINALLAARRAAKEIAARPLPVRAMRYLATVANLVGLHLQKTLMRAEEERQDRRAAVRSPVK